MSPLFLGNFYVVYYMQKFPNYQELFRELFDMIFTKKFPNIKFSVHKGLLYR